MKRYLPLLSAVLLSGCVGVLSATTFDPAHIYQGYPCRDHCEGFKAGYDQAKSSQIISADACRGHSDAEILGCKAYVTDYTYAMTEDQELMQAFE